MEEEDLSVRTSRREMEGPSSPLTPVFAFGLGKREGGKPDGRAEATHQKGSGWRPSAPRSSAAGGLRAWRGGREG